MIFCLSDRWINKHPPSIERERKERGRDFDNKT